MRKSGKHENRTANQPPVALIVCDKSTPIGLHPKLSQIDSPFVISQHELSNSPRALESADLSQKVKCADVIIETLEVEAAKTIYPYCLARKKHVIATNSIAVASNRHFFSGIAAREGARFLFNSSFDIDANILKSIAEMRCRAPIRKIEIQVDSAVRQFFNLLPIDETRSQVLDQLWPKWSLKISRSDKRLLAQLRLLAFIAFGCDLRQLRIPLNTLSSKNHAIDADANCRWSQILHLERYDSIVGAEILMPPANPFDLQSTHSLEVSIETDSGEVIFGTSKNAGLSLLASNIEDEIRTLHRSI